MDTVGAQCETSRKGRRDRQTSARATVEQRISIEAIAWFTKPFEQGQETVMRCTTNGEEHCRGKQASHGTFWISQLRPHPTQQQTFTYNLVWFLFLHLLDGETEIKRGPPLSDKQQTTLMSHFSREGRREAAVSSCLCPSSLVAATLGFASLESFLRTKKG